MKRIALLSSCLIFISLIFSATAESVPNLKPNVLIVIADEWRAQAFGFAGDPNVKTPHFDDFEHESIDCVNAVSTIPVCSPTRATLLTGQHALTHGVFLNDVRLVTNSETFAKVLKAAGYDTGFVGKWHIDGGGRSAFIPPERHQGFDYWKVLECTHDYTNSFYYNGDSPEKLRWTNYDAIAQTHDVQDYLRTRATNTRPFAMMLSWGPPHPNYFTAPEKYRPMYDPAKLILRGNVPEYASRSARRDLAGYYAHCTVLDDCFGELLSTLHKTGLDKNTIVIFTSDHGDMVGSHGQHYKQMPYDESIRIPLLYRLPPQFKAQARSVDAVMHSEDFMPTLLTLCSTKIPATVEGLDFSGYLLGHGEPPADAALISCVTPFSEWSREKGGKEYRGIRTPQFTYVRDLKEPWLLFDNKADPLQMTNLVDQNNSAEIQTRLENLLQQKLAAAHDEFLPGTNYLAKWRYKVNESGAVPYEQ